MAENTKRFVCPKCGDTEHIDVMIQAWARIKQYEPGNVETDLDDAEDRDHEWTSTSPAICGACNRRGPISEFDSDDHDGRPGLTITEVG